MEALLKTSKLWRVTAGTQPEPEYTDPNARTPAEITLHDAWEDARDQAAGIIWLCLDESQQEAIRKVSSNPERMWDTLQELHEQQKPSSRYAALEALLSVRKTEDESLTTYLGRITALMSQYRALRPSDFTLGKFEDEMACVTALRGLDESYANFQANIFLQIDKISVDTLRATFQNEDGRRTLFSSDSTPSVTSAMRTFTPSTSSSLSRPPRPKCTFCGKPGHTEDDCWTKQKAIKRLQDQGNGSHLSMPTERASLASSDDNCSPISSDWIVDTGATRHMTPHRPWFTSYARKTTPIQLADNSIIYGEGVGSVVFTTQEGVELEITDVLHVPQLRNNLFSPFFLVRKRGFEMHAVGPSLAFVQPSTGARITAAIDSTNTGYLRGHTLNGPSLRKAALETANYATQISTCDMDINLWHRRCGHINTEQVRKMIQNGLVDGVKLTSASKPDPVCEPCIAGKQHRHNVPRNPHTPSERLLSIVHSDLKGPIPTATQEGYRYWITFIDDSSRIWALHFLRRKSEAFAAFKEFQAYAEVQHPGCRIAWLQQDGGGEYIGTEFKAHLAKHGIGLRTTEPDEPYQNGVAERANRTIAEGATALLREAKLSDWFWALAVAAFVYVRNRCPTSAIPDTTPHTNWSGQKPNLSHLRVFGCLAYVLVKKKKRRGFASHTKKCIFVGYKEGTKAWLLWDPAARKFEVSSHVQFDERVFPGNHTELTNPFGDLFQMPLPEANVSAHAESESGLHPILAMVPDAPSRGGDDKCNDLTPQSPYLPAVSTPPASPIQDMPPLSPLSPLSPLPESRIPSPIPEPQPAASTAQPGLAPKELAVGEDGMAVGLEDYGRGKRVRQPRVPWNYRGPQWPPSPTNNARQATADNNLEFFMSHDEAMEFAFECAAESAMSTSVAGPTTFAEAMKRPPDEALKWKEAAMAEMETMMKMGVVWVYKSESGETRIIIPVFIDDMTIVSKSVPEKQKFVSELKTRFDLRELGPTNWLLEGHGLWHCRSGSTYSTSWNALTCPTVIQSQHL
ncbi:hypothetical protein CYLTODRAFT_443449 [Cylindrobasidium torrendii FP15055 ss-10]|uniref:Integrase catalytic domain-containing protein n=1 Tax=Cylindrobasidium torrendii FP15055 ss-10 TaxID=1314674 RepID=A0A0D7BDN6_9AGAR|nr:hypothetical protein CYLTODRAFT_443449 [Cylindrobasidium torrendii FP15055 ss-10]